MYSSSYIALLGRQPELGLVELESVVGSDHVEPYGSQTAILTKPIEIDRLGGVIKYARVIYRGSITDLRSLPIDLNTLPVEGSKTSYALSVYGSKLDTRAVLTAGLELKKVLRQRGSVRLISPTKGTEVTVAQLKHNQVIENGFELMIVIARDEMIIARTTAIQDIDWYSRRDYERPARSAKVGMLPPKLAQILINTTGPAAVVDPFCGTGVVLQEALLAGRAACGMDLSQEMVDASQTNLNWLAQEVSTDLPAWHVELADARDVKLPDIACSIVSEGYLGPNLSSQPASSRLDEIKAELRKLYIAALSNWSAQLEPGSEIALCVPAWRIGRAWSYLGLVDDMPRLGYTVKVFKHAPTPLLYARADQVVGRQLLLLRKN